MTVYTANKFAYSDMDWSVPPNVVDISAGRAGGTIVVTFDNGALAGDVYDSSNRFAGAWRLLQQAPAGVSLGPRWLAAIKVTGESCDYGTGTAPNPDYSNVFVWSVGVDSSPDAIVAAETDSATDPPTLTAFPFWLGAASDGIDWASGYWTTTTPVLGSFPDIPQHTGTSAGAITYAESILSYAVGIVIPTSGPLVLPDGGATITITEFILESDDGDAGEPATTTDASWGVLAR